jgi:hypothetical protein
MGSLGQRGIVLGYRLLVVEEDLDVTRDHGAEDIRRSVGNAHARLKAEHGLVEVERGLNVAHHEVGRELPVFHGLSFIREVSADWESAHLGCARNASIHVPCEEERR